MGTRRKGGVCTSQETTRTPQDCASDNTNSVWQQRSSAQGAESPGSQDQHRIHRARKSNLAVTRAGAGKTRRRVGEDKGQFAPSHNIGDGVLQFMLATRIAAHGTATANTNQREWFAEKMGIQDTRYGSRNHGQCLADEKVADDARATMATGASRGLGVSVWSSRRSN